MPPRNKCTSNPHNVPAQMCLKRQKKKKHRGLVVVVIAQVERPMKQKAKGSSHPSRWLLVARGLHALQYKKDICGCWKPRRRVRVHGLEVLKPRLFPFKSVNRYRKK